MQHAFSEMFVLLTTSNFPNVMLSSYNNQRMLAFFFIIYLVVGLFLLLNLLLGIFYSSYQTKADDSLNNDIEARDEMIARLFKKTDTKNTGILEKD